MNKSPMLELVRRALALGYVERRPDPGDKRAKIIHFTSDGLRMLEHLHTGVTEAERRMGGIIGKGFLAEAKMRLQSYVKGDGALRTVDDGTRADDANPREGRVHGSPRRHPEQLSPEQLSPEQIRPGQRGAMR